MTIAEMQYIRITQVNALVYLNLIRIYERLNGNEITAFLLNEKRRPILIKKALLTLALLEKSVKKLIKKTLLQSKFHGCRIVHKGTPELTARGVRTGSMTLAFKSRFINFN